MSHPSTKRAWCHSALGIPFNVIETKTNSYYITEKMECDTGGKGYENILNSKILLHLFFI